MSAGSHRFAPAPPTGEGAGGARFAAVRRQLGFTLRALWARGPALQGFGGGLARLRPFLSDAGIHLPEAVPAVAGQPGASLYRAAAAHAAAHLAFSGAPWSRAGLEPVQVALAGLLEDARVEALACLEMPGLRALWLPFHAARPATRADFTGLAARLARALLDPGHLDGHPWVEEGCSRFLDPDLDLTDAAFVRPLAVVLGEDIVRLGLPFSPRTWVVEPAYRDDNTALWQPGEGDLVPVPGDESAPVEPDATSAAPGGGAEELAGTDASGDEADAGASGAHAGGAGAGAPLRVFQYPEWDYVAGTTRPRWCTVHETRLPPGDPALVTGALDRHRDLLERIDALLRGSQLRRPVRLRRQMEGDRFDLERVVESAVDLRSRRTPDPRVHVRTDHRERDLAVLVLLDLSESTNDPVRGSGRTVLALARDATALLASAMARIGDPFAVHGFCSNGRGEVRYYRFKDFGQPFDGEAHARLAGMRGHLSTRMGGALRHAAQWLRPRACDRKLVLLVTDGEPHDIDTHDPRYLLHDARKAVDEARRAGVHTYCMSLDPRADAYVSRIFGQRNYLVLDRIERLPEKLPALYLRLTR